MLHSCQLLIEVGRAGPSQSLSTVLERQHCVTFIWNKCALRYGPIGTTRSTGESGGTVTQRRIPGCIRLILRVLLDHLSTLRAGLGPSLCVEKFGGKDIGFGGKVQPAFVFKYIKRSLKEDHC